MESTSVAFDSSFDTCRTCDAATCPTQHPHIDVDVTIKNLRNVTFETVSPRAPRLSKMRLLRHLTLRSWQMWFTNLRIFTAIEGVPDMFGDIVTPSHAAHKSMGTDVYDVKEFLEVAPYKLGGPLSTHCVCACRSHGFGNPTARWQNAWISLPSAQP